MASERARLETQIIKQGKAARGYCLTLCRDDAEADDLLQAAIVRLLERADNESSELMSVRAALCQSAHQIFRETRRKRGREYQPRGEQTIETLIDLSGAFPAAAEDSAILRDVLRAVDMMPQHMGSALTLVAVYGHSWEDAAEILEMNVGSVKSNVARARNELKKRFPEPQ